MTVTGDARVGTDTLTAVESVRGTNLADTYNATGFNGASTDFGPTSTFNEFEGMAGNDTITGNGNTRISYISSTGGVTVDLIAGTAIGNSSVGTDTITGGVNSVRGSNFNDILVAKGGANTLIGGTGADQFVFKANLANGATISDFAGNGASVGRSIEFDGFGTIAQGATFTFISTTGTDSLWQIHSGLDGHNEQIVLKGITTSAGVMAATTCSFPRASRVCEAAYDFQQYPSLKQGSVRLDRLVYLHQRISDRHVAGRGPDG